MISKKEFLAMTECTPNSRLSEEAASWSGSVSHRDI